MNDCQRCGGTGVYTWGGTLNGRPVHSGPCFACVGGGEFPPRRRRATRKRTQFDETAHFRAEGGGE